MAIDQGATDYWLLALPWYSCLFLNYCCLLFVLNIVIGYSHVNACNIDANCHEDAPVIFFIFYSLYIIVFGSMCTIITIIVRMTTNLPFLFLPIMCLCYAWIQLFVLLLVVLFSMFFLLFFVVFCALQMSSKMFFKIRQESKERVRIFSVSYYRFQQKQFSYAVELNFPFNDCVCLVSLQRDSILSFQLPFCLFFSNTSCHTFGLFNQASMTTLPELNCLTNWDTRCLMVIATFCNFILLLFLLLSVSFSWPDYLMSHFFCLLNFFIFTAFASAAVSQLSITYYPKRQCPRTLR